LCGGCLTGCDNCVAGVTSTGILAPHATGWPRATAKHFSCESGDTAVPAVDTTGADTNAVRSLHGESRRRPPAEHCVYQAHLSVCTAARTNSAAALVDPLGSALVSLWVYQKAQHDARIVEEGKRNAMRALHYERASIGRCDGNVVDVRYALI
jgi:hypothetical protein